MKVLAIDTASPRPSLAISTDLLEREVELPSGPELSSRILPELARLLAAAGLARGEINRIAVVAGPGSFTGIRIGLATAWGLAASLAIPVELEDTLAAAAETARPSDSPVPVALPAERGDVYFGRFDLTGGRASAIGPSAILPGAVLEQRRPELPFRPRESPTLSLALARAVRRAPRPDAMKLDAVYLRDSAAEERRGTAE